MMEGIYSRKWYIEEEGGFRKYKGNDSRIWRKTECKSEEAREVGLGRRVRL